MSRVSPDRVILGLLAAQSCHGYQLLEHFQDPSRLGRIWKLSTSRLYTLLKHLEQKELIDGREESTENAPTRTIYWLTASGENQLYMWLENPMPSASTRNIRTEFLSRLYIAQVLNKPVQPIIDAQRTAIQYQIARLCERTTTAELHIGTLANKLQLREMHFIMGWLAECEQLLVGVHN